MALIVEDGSVVTNANSYVSLADANAYLAAVPLANLATWEALSDEVKECLLIFATRILDQKTSWNGMKTVAASSLRWPRVGVYDCDSNVIASDAIPPGVTAAVCDLALWFSVDGRNPLTVSDSQGIQQLSVDVISITYKADHDATATQALPRGLNDTLCGLGTIRYGSRSSFGPINKV